MHFFEKWSNPFPTFFPHKVNSQVVFVHEYKYYHKVQSEPGVLALECYLPERSY